MKSFCRVLICAVVSSVLLAGPLYSIEIPTGLAGLQNEVTRNVASARQDADSVNVPESAVGDGQASLYLSDRSRWVSVPADVPIRLYHSSGRLGLVRAGEAEQGPVGHYSSGGAIVFEEGGVYVVDYAEPESLVEDPRGLQGYIPTPSRYERLPESASRFNPIPLLLVGLAAGGWVGLGLNVDDGTTGALVLSGVAILGGQGGLAALDATQDNMWKRDVQLDDNIAENERRRREFQQEQRRIESANEELLEQTNEKIRLRNRHAGYVSVKDVETGRVTRLWLAD